MDNFNTPNLPSKLIKCSVFFFSKEIERKLYLIVELALLNTTKFVDGFISSNSKKV